MRLPRSAVALAAALALALAGAGAAGCKPSSLTPLGIEEKGPETPSPDDVNGLWQGIGADGEDVRFQVGSGEISDIRIDGRGRCARLFFTGDHFLLEGNSFALEFSLESGGRIFLTGSFTSGRTCSGNYTYTGVSVIQGCPRDGAGSFVATKIR